MGRKRKAVKARRACPRCGGPKTFDALMCLACNTSKRRTVAISGYRDRGGKRLHRLRAEKAFGKPLPAGVVVHHADGTKHDDAPLVICQDQSYHALLHARMRIFKAGGNPDMDAWCCYCKQPRPREEFHQRKNTFGRKPGSLTTVCKSCGVKRTRETRDRRRSGVMIV